MQRFTGWVLALLAVLCVAPADAASRIDWETGNASWVVDLVTADEVSARLALHQGRITAFTPADAKLYAVLLDDPSQLSALERTLKARPDATRQILAARISDHYCEPINLGRNGELSVFIDEAIHRDAELLVVINASGDILSTRPVWESPRELALAVE